MPLKLSLFSDRPNTDLTAPVPVLLSRPDSPTPSERECGCRWVKASSSRLLSSPSTPRPSARPTWQSWRTPWTCGESARFFYWLLRGGGGGHTHTHTQRGFERGLTKHYSPFNSSMSLRSNNRNVDSKSLTRTKRWKTFCFVSCSRRSMMKISFVFSDFSNAASLNWTLLKAGISTS